MENEVRQWIGGLCVALAALIGAAATHGFSEFLSAALLTAAVLVGMTSLAAIAYALLTSKPAETRD